MKLSLSIAGSTAGVMATDRRAGQAFAAPPASVATPPTTLKGDMLYRTLGEHARTDIDNCPGRAPHRPST
jgi:hypothetical protein